MHDETRMTLTGVAESELGPSLASNSCFHIFLLKYSCFAYFQVWSDFKNNTKKKRAKINRAATGTGGGPALQIALTELELRVLQIIGEQAATGMAVEEAGFQV